MLYIICILAVVVLMCSLPPCWLTDRCVCMSESMTFSSSLTNTIIIAGIIAKALRPEYPPISAFFFLRIILLVLCIRYFASDFCCISVIIHLNLFTVSFIVSPFINFIISFWLKPFISLALLFGMKGPLIFSKFLYCSSSSSVWIIIFMISDVL